MSKTVIQTDQAPAAIGPYAQAVKAQGFLFCSGQIGLSPKTSELVGGGVEAEARQVMANLAAVLAAAGASFRDVVRTTIYLTNMADFAIVNRIYGESVGAPPPARATVQVAGLPKGASVEIDAIACLPT